MTAQRAYKPPETLLLPFGAEVFRTAQRVRRSLALAKIMVTGERIWQALWPATGLACLFVALAFLNVWTGPFHAAAPPLAAGAVLYGAWRVFRTTRIPDTHEIARRLERDSGLTHRPLAAVSDRIEAGASDPVAQALWQAHQIRAVAALERVRGIRPQADLSSSDPFALRYLVLLLAGASFVLAGDQAGPRLAKALTPDLAGLAGAPPQIEAMIDPPAYTGLPPVDLIHGALGGEMPAGSTLTVNVQGSSRAPVARVSPAPKGFTFGRKALTESGESRYELRIPLAETTTIDVRRGFRSLGRWSIPIAPDAPPVIAFAAPPKETPQHSVRIDYTLADDFGIKSVTLRLRPKMAATSTSTVEIPLPAPAKGRTDGTMHAYRDLTSSKWAGLDVEMTLAARDAADHEAVSRTVTFRLPERTFSDPLARALVDARRTLARDRGASDDVAAFLRSVTEPPAREFSPLSIYLGLRSAYWRLRTAFDPDVIDSVGDELWDIAIAIEDGTKGQAEANLRAAREALNEALANGAPPEEIQRRIAELKDALSRYLRDLSEKMPSTETSFVDPNLRAVSPSDLMTMLDTLDSLAQTGSTEAAQQMLRNLEDILEQLNTEQAATPDPNSPQARQEQALKDLSKLMGEQRALMDQTFRQSEMVPDYPGVTITKPGGSAQDPAGKKLAEQQERLRKDLAAIAKRLGGSEPGQDKAGAIPKSFGEADQAMEGARDWLTEGQSRRAVARQKAALDALRAGAQALAQSLQGQPGQRQPGARAGGIFPSADPLGRPNAGAPDLGQGVKVPTKADVQRAREILDEIRRRAGELGRPAPERDYLNRLLDRF